MNAFRKWAGTDPLPCSTVTRPKQHANATRQIGRTMPGKCTLQWGHYRVGWRLFLSGLYRDETGQDVVEYGMIVATIAVVVLIGTMTFGNQIRPWFERLAGMITTTGT